MAKSYIEIKRIIQPLFQRYRNTYRGPRSSEKENLEMNKILIDLKRLEQKVNNLNNDSYEDVRIFIGQVDPELVAIHSENEDGLYYSFNDIKVHYANDSATPSYVEIETISTLAGKMSRILQKIKMLEKK
jgi:hypothetical protein